MTWGSQLQLAVRSWQRPRRMGSSTKATAPPSSHPPPRSGRGEAAPECHIPHVPDSAATSWDRDWALVYKIRLWLMYSRQGVGTFWKWLQLFSVVWTQSEDANLSLPRPMISVKETVIFLLFERGTWGGGYFLGQISPVLILWSQYLYITNRWIVHYWCNIIHIFIDT